MNKAELVNALADRLDGDRKVAAAAVDGLLEVIVQAVRSGDSVSVLGFGVFERRERAARSARNPRTGQLIQIAPTAVPAFRPGAKFRDVVSGARPHSGAPAARSGRTVPPRPTASATGAINGAVAPVPTAVAGATISGGAGPAAKPAGEKAASKPRTGKAQSDKAQSDKAQSDKAQTQKAQDGKARTGKAQPGKAEPKAKAGKAAKNGKAADKGKKKPKK